jgi:hypothetical protein
VVKRLSADNDTLAAGGGRDELVLGGGAAGLFIGVAAARSAAVELDAVARAGDAISLAWAGGASRVVWHGGGLWEGGSAAGAERWADGWRWAELVVGVIIEGRLAETAGDVGNGDLIKGTVLGLEDGLGGMWRDWLWRLDLWDGEGAALGNVGGESAGFTAGGRRRVLAWRAGVLAWGRWLAGGRWLGWLAGLVGWNIENVQNATSGGLGGWWLGWIVRHVVPIDDVLWNC